jgi:4-amino-4-deoxy-L-arabinose transferase-like glycosyltransferase
MARPFILRSLLLLAACTAVYLVGNANIALWDRDEPRYAQTSRQMLQSGDWIVPHLMEDVRGAKPIFIYWCQALSMKLTGHDDAFAARLPSVIGMTLTLALLLVMLSRWIGPQRAWWTVFIFASSALTIAAAKMSITDAVLLLFITTSQLGLYAILRGRAGWGTIAFFGISVGFAGLTKGPVVLGVLAATLIALAILNFIDRKKPWIARAKARLTARSKSPAGVVAMKWILATLLVIAVIAPWLVLMERNQPGYLLNTLWKEVIKRAGKPLEGHKGPPGYYLVLVWATYFPWSLLLPTAITVAWRHRKVPQVRFAICAIAGPWVMFEIVQTKLPHYVLPTYPFLAFLTADALVRCVRHQHDDLVHKRFIAMTAAWAVIAVLIGFAPWAVFVVLGGLNESLVNAMTLLSAVALAYAFVVFRHAKSHRLQPMAASMGIGMLAVMFIFAGVYLPRADFLRLSPNVAAVLRAHGATKPGDVLSIGYKEPSLVFHQGGTLRPAEKEFLTTHEPSQWPEWIVIKGSIWETLDADIQNRFEIVDAFHGINPADDPKPVDVLVARQKNRSTATRTATLP